MSAKRHTVGARKRKRYVVLRSRLGPTAILFDSRRSLNVINGGKTDSLEAVRRAAEEHWGDEAREVSEANWLKTHPYGQRSVS